MSSDERTVIGQEDLTRGLRELGLQAGSLVQVHSSLSAFGQVEGGAETVVDALLEVIGPEGTLMMPTFNHGSERLFDLRQSKSTNGAITEALRGRPAAYRSFHATHPYAAIGPLAELLTSEHPATFDLKSPLGKLAALGGQVLLLGVGMNRNTMAHIAETLFHAPCTADGVYPRPVRDAAGQTLTTYGLVWRDGECQVEWDPVESELRRRGQIVDGRIGEAAVMLMLGAHVMAATVELCRKHCPQCTTRPDFRSF